MRREGRRIDDKVSPRHQRRIGRPAKGCWACGTPCTEHEPASGPWSRSAPGGRRRKAAHRRVPDSDGKADWSSGRQFRDVSAASAPATGRIVLTGTELGQWRSFVASLRDGQSATIDPTRHRQGAALTEGNGSMRPNCPNRYEGADERRVGKE